MHKKIAKNLQKPSKSSKMSASLYAIFSSKKVLEFSLAFRTLFILVDVLTTRRVLKKIKRIGTLAADAVKLKKKLSNLTERAKKASKAKHGQFGASSTIRGLLVGLLHII